MSRVFRSQPTGPKIVQTAVAPAALRLVDADGFSHLLPLTDQQLALLIEDGTTALLRRFRRQLGHRYGQGV